MSTHENKGWLLPNEPLSAVQNLINGCLIAQNKGAYSFEESSVIWESIKYLVQLQVSLRETEGDLNTILNNELAKAEEEEEKEKEEEVDTNV